MFSFDLFQCCDFVYLEQLKGFIWNEQACPCVCKDSV